MDVHMNTKKWLVAILNLAAVIVVLYHTEAVMEWIAEDEEGSTFIVFMLVVLLAAIPAIPFGIVSGIIGAKYGILWGSLLNITASALAAVFVYLLFRYLLYEQGTVLLRRYTPLRRMDGFIKHHTFWALLIARIIPIIPAAVINVYAGVFGLSFTLFLFSTFLGKIPVLFVFTFVGDSVGSGSTKWISMVVIYLLFLLIVYGIYQLLTRTRR
ncbi:TVP38/TMEM64 family inner membrane protein YdjZ [compost metagenome]